MISCKARILTERCDYLCDDCGKKYGRNKDNDDEDDDADDDAANDDDGGDDDTEILSRRSVARWEVPMKNELHGTVRPPHMCCSPRRAGPRFAL